MDPARGKKIWSLRTSPHGEVDSHLNDWTGMNGWMDGSKEGSNQESTQRGRGGRDRKKG